MVWSLSKLGSILIYPIDLFCQFGFTLMLWNTVLHLSAVFIALRTLYGNGLLFLWIIDIMVEGLALFFTHIISQTDARMVQAPHIDLRVGMHAFLNLVLMLWNCLILYASTTRNNEWQDSDNYVRVAIWISISSGLAVHSLVFLCPWRFITERRKSMISRRLRWLTAEDRRKQSLSTDVHRSSFNIPELSEWINSENETGLRSFWLTTLDATYLDPSVFKSYIDHKPSTSHDTHCTPVFVDVRNYQTIFWPIVHQLSLIDPAYLTALSDASMECFGYYPQLNRFLQHLFELGIWETRWAHYIIDWFRFNPWDKACEIHPNDFYETDEPQRAATSLIFNPLLDYVGTSFERQNDKHKYNAIPVPRTTSVLLVIQGVDTRSLGSEVEVLIRSLHMKESLQHLKVIAVGKSDTLHQICTRKKHSKVHQYTRTMFLSDEGTVQLDSSLRIGDVLELHSNSLDALHRSIHSASGPEGYIISEEARSYFNDPFTGSNQDLLISNVFSKLLGRLETRKRIENWLRQLHVLRYSRIRRVLRDDDAQVAQELVAVFASNSYKTDISSLTNEQAIQIMNLIDTILIQGFSTNFPIENYDTFIHTAQQCLIRLSEASGHFPDALVLQNVELVTSTPVTEGGFADVYRGRHTNYKGHTAEVALKVLKLRTTSYFSLTTEEKQGREKKFYKEALTWQYLDHENITVFYGIDRNTFPGKQAMVSQWMRHGTILDYMKKNSPFSQHAISCLSDIAAGLEYLHSHNVVHGDLCGRNILIDKRGRACLTDFGLTSFIESDTALKSTRRDGSPNWTAPELFEPEQFNLRFQRTAASDVYAYACVCYEIWTGGSPPFHNLWPETAVMFKVIAGARPGQPNDILGELMPNELWNVIQLCWTMQPQERLDSKVLSATMKDLHRQNLTADLIPSRASSSASGSMNDLNGDVQPNSDSSSSESEINSDLEADAESESIPMIRRSPAPPPPLPRRLKGKLRQVSIRDYVTFGPIKWGADPEGEFLAIIEEMYRNDSVKRGAMDEPDSLKKNNPKYVKLVFGSLAQANNFAMTWAVHRYQPYKRVKATLYPAV